MEQNSKYIKPDKIWPGGEYIMNNLIFKSFDTFEEGIEEVIKCVPQLKVYIGDTHTEEQVIERLMDEVRANIPSVYRPEYPATYAISVSAREVGFKTRNYLAFGWKINTENDKITYGFRVTVLSKNRFARVDSVSETLLANGWQKRETKERIV